MWEYLPLLSIPCASALMSHWALSQCFPTSPSCVSCTDHRCPSLFSLSTLPTGLSPLSLSLVTVLYTAPWKIFLKYRPSRLSVGSNGELLFRHSPFHWNNQKYLVKIQNPNNTKPTLLLKPHRADRPYQLKLEWRTHARVQIWSTVLGYRNKAKISHKKLGPQRTMLSG